MDNTLAFIIASLSTIIPSFIMELINELRMFKDAADAGYKINLEKFSKIGDDVENSSKTSMLYLLIPYFNLFMVLCNTAKYNQVRENILDELHVLGVLEEMTEREKKLYSQNPTSLNAIIVPIKEQQKLDTALKLSINNGPIQGEILYCIDEKTNDIEILKSTGFFSWFSEEQQRTFIVGMLGEVVEEATKQYGSIEAFTHTIDENPEEEISIYIGSDKKEETTADKITELKEYREELISQEERKEEKVSNKVKVKIRKK